MRLPHIDVDHPLVLAPMDAITDRPTRRLARRLGADLVFTEFVSAEGLAHEARTSHLKLRIAPDEHPVAVQIFGSRVESMVTAAHAAAAAGPDLIDLNFGCPVRKVAGKGGGAGLLRDPDKLEAMARAVVRAMTLPVTAKIRLGWDQGSINVLDVCRRLEQVGVAAVTIHARTRSQGYGGQPDWSWIARAKQAVGIPIIGNGNVQTPEDAARLFAETGCDGVMIGRAATGYPWIFRETRAYLETGRHLAPPSPAERCALLLELLQESALEKGERRAVVEARKQYRGFFRGLPGAGALRSALMSAIDIATIAEMLAQWQPRVEEWMTRPEERE